MRGKKCGSIFMAIGLLFLVAALILTLYNVWDESRADAAAQKVLEQLREDTKEEWQPESKESGEYEEEPTQDLELQNPEEVEIPNYILNPNMSMPTKEIDGNSYIGTLYIEALDLFLPIMSDWSYEKLRIAPCRYSGSAYTKNLVLAGHNYRKHFSGLKALAIGDRITFTDMDGNTFVYEVGDVEILQPTAVEEMTDSGWDLSLFTCTYGGQTRFTLRCRQVP
ncbi:MAG: sortase [bacterium]|nr:sortase [bacterium]